MAESDGGERRPRRLRTRTKLETPRRARARCGPCPKLGACVAASCVGVEYGGLIYPTIYPYLRELGTPHGLLASPPTAFSLAKTARVRTARVGGRTAADRRRRR